MTDQGGILTKNSAPDPKFKGDDLKIKLARMFTIVHKSVEDMSARFYEELRRKVYITPKSYLDGINMYISSLEKKRDEEKLNMDRLSNGCKKLKDTNAQISDLQISLADLIPRLDVENVKAAEKAEIIKANKQIAF